MYEFTAGLLRGSLFAGARVTLRRTLTARNFHLALLAFGQLVDATGRCRAAGAFDFLGCSVHTAGKAQATGALILRRCLFHD